MLDFTPDPIAIQLGPLPVYWYGIGYALGLAAAYLVMVRLARRAGEDAEILGNGIIIVAVAALIGGRAYHVIDQWALYKDDPIKIFLPPYSGLGVYGGIVTGTIAAFLYARYKKVPFLRWADIVAPGLFVMQAIARWGNFFNQELYGSPTTLPWGIPIDCAHRIAGLPVRRAFPLETTRFHPCSCTSRCRGCSARSCSSGSASTLRKRLRPGDLLLVFFIWYGARALRLETFRAGQLDVLRRPDRADRVAPVHRSRRWSSCSGVIGRPPARRPADASRRSRPGAPSAARSTRIDDRGRVRRRGRGTTTRTTDDRSTTTPTDDEARTTTAGTPDRRRGRRPSTTGDRADDDPARRRSRRARAGRDRLTEPEPPPATGRRRPPPGRVSPEALAAARGGAVEGLAWLGRPPEAKASILYRLLRLVARFVIFGVFRFRIRTSGRERLPRGGYLLVAAAHRGWMDPFVVMHAMPLQPRAWFLGSAPSTFTSRWRERLIHRVGGLLPVWRGGVGDRAARRVGAGGHRQRGRLRPDARGHGQRAARAGSGRSGRAGRSSPCGRTHRSCRSRSRAPRSSTSAGGWRSRVLPATSARALAGLPPDAPFPQPGHARSSTLAAAMSDALGRDPRTGGRGAATRGPSTRPSIRAGCASG